MVLFVILYEMVGEGLWLRTLKELQGWVWEHRKEECCGQRKGPYLEHAWHV